MLYIDHDNFPATGGKDRYEWHAWIYKEFKKEFDSLSNLAKELFNYAYSVNWYKLEEAQSKKIDTAIKNMKNELDC